MTATSPSVQAAPPSWLAKYWPGLVLCAVVAAVAWSAAEVEKNIIDNAVVDALVIAIIVGVLLRNLLTLPKAIDPGAKYASKQILEASVFLLGASVDFGQIVDAGLTLFLLIAFSVIGGLTLTWVVGHYVMGLPSRLSVLVGVGNSICGNSAVAAVAPAIRATPDEVATAIGISAVMGIGQILLLQILLLPLLGPGLDLTNYQYGIVAGIAVYAVPQVVAASFAVSTLSGTVATLVKLVRVLFLGPMIIGLGFLHRNSEDAPPSQTTMERVKLYVPWFVAGFLLFAVLRSSGVISDSLGDDAKTLSKLLFVGAMVGLGLGVDLRKVGAVGPRVAATILVSMSFMIVVALVGTFAFDLTSSG
jgi:uncharacterized integral membrane protein (TIGR00698 family)